MGWDGSGTPRRARPRGRARRFRARRFTGGPASAHARGGARAVLSLLLFEIGDVAATAVRSRPRAEAHLETLLRAARQVEPDLQVLKTTTLERHLAILVLPARLAVFAFGAFAALAFVLALTGLYGLVSYSVAGKTHEVGIRLSLGAQPWSVVASLVRSGLVLVGVGCAVGLLMGIGAGMGLRSLLLHVDALDPVTFVLVPAAFLAVATLATWIPARRAARVDPSEALRGN